ncbi:MAG: AsmA-like C-terminal region-containing protein [Spirochaetota bacterium]|uniref:AsmA family protein n=1 Tax=Candidatus Avelusimicrobium faecicola TaxID=3416205 RepID=UPI002A5BD611|nr:AsmA-like C-terminal region-containing protein [Spirochaetota bacterium]MDY6128934.1 AsmA-like C-terminal region-containing protein [Elusimicrobiaceae bacterium]
MKKKLKKISKWGFYILGGLLLAAALADTGLRWASSSRRVKNYLVQKVSAALRRDVRLKQVRASLFGVRVSGLEVAEQGGFQQGTFLSVDKAGARFSLIHLLHGHLKLRTVFLHGGAIRITRGADGKFNFADLSSSSVPSAQKEAHADPFLPRITLGLLDIEQLDVFYIDAAQNRSLAVQQFMLRARRLMFTEPFRVISKAQVRWVEGDFPLESTLAFNARLNLADLDLEKAALDITNLIVRYRSTPAVLTGQIKNFTNPSALLALEISRLSNDTLAELAPDTPEFLIPALRVDVAARAHLADSRAQISRLHLQLPGGELNATAKAAFKERADYQAEGDFAFNLDELAALSPILASTYGVTGQITGAFQAAADNWNAKLSVQQVGATLPAAGRLDGLSTQITAEGLKTLAVKDLSGTLNGAHFDGYLTAVNRPLYVDARLELNMEKFILPPQAEPAPEQTQAETTGTEQSVQAPAAEAVPAATQTQEKSAGTEQATPQGPQAQTAPAQTVLAQTAPQGPQAAPAQEQTALAPAQQGPQANTPKAKFPPVHLRAQIKSGPVSVPYFYAKSVDIHTRLTGITAELDKADGTAEMQIGEGEIQDIYKLTQANSVTKAMFLSLSVVSRVINSLNVVDLLSKLMPGGKEQMPEKKTDGKLAFESFSGALKFNKGVMEMTKGSFVSDFMSLKISGTTNFRNGVLNMQVNAAPGKHYDTGIMPITLKIGGTVDEPKGSLSMLGSAAALVTQAVGNNFASNAVKKGVGGFFGLFKKKQDAPVEPFPGQEDTFVPVDPQELLNPAEKNIAEGGSK